MNSVQKNSPFLNGTLTVDFTAEPLRSYLDQIKGQFF